MADSENSGGVRIGDIAERILKRKVLQGEQENGSPIAPPAPPQMDPIANLVQDETRDEGEEVPQETAPAPVETPKVQETPLVEPVAEPEQKEEERPVVQPVTPRNTRGEERAEKQNAEYVPQNDNTELFAEWENYLAEEEQAGTQEPSFTPEQTEDETQLVTPIQRELGTYPAGTMDFLRENDLPIDWLSTEDGQYWLESRQEQQPEMIFPADTGGTTIPNMPEYTPQFGVEDFLNLGVNPAVAESYWDGYTRNSRGSNDFTGSYNAVVDNIVNSLQNSEVPPWLNTENIIANREYQGAPYQQTEFDDIAKSVMQEIPGRIGDAIVNSLSNGVSNVPADSAEQITQNRERPGTSYQSTELDNAVRDIVQDLIGNMAADTANVDVIAPDVAGNRTRDENNKFVNEEFNQAVKDVFAPDWQSNFQLNQPILSGNDPLNEPEYGSPEWYAENGLSWAEGTSLSDEGAGIVYDLVADLINASESDGWRTEQASDLYGTLPAINPETPGAEILEQERRDRINDLVRQIEADDELRDDRPDITGQDVKNAIDESQNSTREFTDSLVDFARDVTEPASTAVSEWANTDNSSYDERTQSANEAALEAGYYPGTAEYDEFVQNIILSEQQAEQEAAALAEQQEQGRRDRAEERQNAERESYRQDAIQDLIETYGLNSNLAERIVENPDAYEYNEETGRWGMPGMSRGLSWEDAVGSERLMDDLMLMDAPAVSENGELNTAAQALFLGLENADENGNYSGGQYPDYGNGNVGLTPEQKLHLFDKGGFFNDSSGITINPDFVNLMAVDSTHASRNPELAKTVKMTDGEFEYEYEKFLEANPMIKLMLDAGMITDEDVIKNFFNNLELTKGPAYNRGGGSGSGYRGYGYGGGGYGYGYGGGGYGRSSTPTAKNQNEQRINNIMKNWTF